MSENEAQARIKINKLLEESDWRFFDNENGQANVLLEQNVKLTKSLIDALGNDFEKTKNGYTDYSLIGSDGRVVCVVEAKAERLHPLVGKEQARAYAYKHNARFVILSNGNQHFLWDTWLGNPRVITKFPRLDELAEFQIFQPTAANVTRIEIKDDFIVQTQKPDYANDPRFRGEGEQKRSFIEENKLRFLRPYQVRAMDAVQRQIADGKDRFLLEMATGTGKTLTSAAVIKMFLKSSNVQRVLFLVDRLELEDQADKAFKAYLKNDFRTVIYKENKSDWQNAEIVVSTVQSLLTKNKYKRQFKPDDFQLIISDEAHRSIGGNSRAVFEYFIGYKLGLTATPKNYLKKIDTASLNASDPRELERRLLLDTYSIFGCENGEPTFSYSLADGVKDGFLVNPFVLDARTEITTQLLSDKGFSVLVGKEIESETSVDELKTADEAATDASAASGEQKETFFSRDFERKFFSENTNRAFCKTFLENALRDPITGEIGKTIIFAVSQNHAAKLAQFLNEYADKMFPDKYNSDFALQVTSLIKDAQQMTINFTNNNLNGRSEFDALYQTSKTRVCVTVGMMTTGYDCPDLLNVCLMRPIFSPSDFVQIKGRGTRKHNFTVDMRDRERAKEIGRNDKTGFRLFDFFANCEFFEEKFDYDAVLKLPVEKSDGEERTDTGGDGINIDEFDSKLADELKTLQQIAVGADGMKIDRKLFERFEDRVKSDDEIKKMVEGRDFGAIEDYIVGNIFDKPNEYYNLDKLRKNLKIDRRLGLREIVEKIFGFVPYFKNKNELLEEEFDKFDSRYPLAEDDFTVAKSFFKAYLTDTEFREIVESRQFARMATNPNGAVFRKVSIDLRNQITEYVKDNIPLNQFME
ncbi:MAG: DEAD/DEAH box helicase family protein [Acidobacteriota bacterium]|nr:DEAD/DEAH box helicase family protein [Acidobacteriota bacterium]